MGDPGDPADMAAGKGALSVRMAAEGSTGRTVRMAAVIFPEEDRDTDESPKE